MLITNADIVTARDFIVPICFLILLRSVVYVSYASFTTRSELIEFELTNAE